MISFGPSKMLKTSLERLILGSNRWLIFDPHKKWVNHLQNNAYPFAGNQPFPNMAIQGKVTDCGLINSEHQGD